MQSVDVRAVPRARRTGLLTGIRPCERVLLVYFLYVAVRGVLLPTGSPIALAGLVAAGLLVSFMCHLEARRPRQWSSIARHWILLATILPAYWSLEWISGAPLELLQSVWVGWDRFLLDSLWLRSAIESAGAAGPWLLETTYLLLYAIPPVSLGLVYAFAGRRAADRYLLVLMLGTFAAYALIPLVPVISPRTAFPGADLPTIKTGVRAVNVWVLDNLDNAVTVFPSGHVAVAFASAFGLLTVFRRRPLIWGPFFVLAALVYLATVYGRYHYFVDGASSVAVAALAWRWLERENQFES